MKLSYFPLVLFALSGCVSQQSFDALTERVDRVEVSVQSAQDCCTKNSETLDRMHQKLMQK